MTTNWLRFTPSRFVSLTIRANRHATQPARRIRLRTSAEQVMQQAFPTNWYFAQGDVVELVSRAQLAASVEELWHHEFARAQKARRAGDKSFARSWLAVLRTRQQLRLAGSRLALV